MYKSDILILESELITILASLAKTGEISCAMFIKLQNDLSTIKILKGWEAATCTAGGPPIEYPCEI